MIDRVVRVNGTPVGDNIKWKNVNGQLRVEVNGVIAPLFAPADFDAILIDSGGGNDVIEATFSGLSDFPATVLAGSGNDIISGSNGHDVLVGGTGHDYLMGAAGDDTLVGARGDDTLYGSDGADHLLGSAGNDTAQSEGNVDTIDCEIVTPIDSWIPLPEYDAGLEDVRVKQVAGRGYVAVLDFYWGSTGFREAITSVVREGNTFRITAAVERWTGASLTALTRHLKTVTLGNLTDGAYSVVVHRPAGNAVERQRFVVS
ncbi:MAG: hypothetical protein ABIP55_11815 [Tepidisphaeraceae bacterium]